MFVSVTKNSVIAYIVIFAAIGFGILVVVVLFIY